MRALIPGFANCYYDRETCEPPKHTKQAFIDLKILTVYSLILKNIMLFIYKTRYLPHLIPQAIIQILSSESSHSIQESPPRLTVQQNTMFFKGTRLYSELIAESTKNNSPLPTVTFCCFKNHLKSYLFSIQAKGTVEEWCPENFRLCTQVAVRRSPRLNPDINSQQQ